MEFRILGPTELSGSGPDNILLPPQLWGVLASLLMAEGKPVPVDSLVDHLWDWNAPPMAIATIRTYVSRINTLLERDGIRIRRRARGYELPVDPQSVDLHQFRSLRRQAESVAASGDLGHAAALLRQADELWRGPAPVASRGRTSTEPVPEQSLGKLTSTDPKARTADATIQIASAGAGFSFRSRFHPRSLPSPPALAYRQVLSHRSC